MIDKRSKKMQRQLEACIEKNCKINPKKSRKKRFIERGKCVDTVPECKRIDLEIIKEWESETIEWYKNKLERNKFLLNYVRKNKITDISQVDFNKFYSKNKKYFKNMKKNSAEVELKEAISGDLKYYDKTDRIELSAAKDNLKYTIKELRKLKGN